MRRLQMQFEGRVDIDAGGPDMSAHSLERRDALKMIAYLGSAALSLMLTEGAESLIVVDDDGEVTGLLSVGRVSRLLSEPSKP